MPAGVSSIRYASFFAAAMLSMLAGAQCVHMYYRPLDDLENLIEEELHMQEKIHEHINR